jgi:transposase
LQIVGTGNRMEERAILLASLQDFARLRRLAGLTPLQRSTGGKRKLGATSKMGERTLRRLLIIGSIAVVLRVYRHWRRSEAFWDRHSGTPQLIP